VFDASHDFPLSSNVTLTFGDEPFGLPYACSRHFPLSVRHASPRQTGGMARLPIPSAARINADVRPPANRFLAKGHQNNANLNSLNSPCARRSIHMRITTIALAVPNNGQL
jgi:hypothetical protein